MEVCVEEVRVWSKKWDIKLKEYRVKLKLKTLEILCTS